MSSNDTTSSDTSSDLNVSLGITAGYSLGYFLAFVLLRTKFKVFYAPKQEAEFPLAPKELSNGRFKWLFELWKTTDDDIFNMAGLDALMYLRFLRLCFTLFLVFIPFGIFVLLPLNITGDGGATGFDVYTMTNIKENAPRLWAHLIGVYCFTLATLYLLTREYKQFITIRQRYLLQSHVHHYSILVREIPPQYRTDEKLKEFFNEVFPGKVVGAYIARKLSNLSKKVKKHENYVKKYEHALAVQEQDEKHERPMRRKYLGCCGKKEDVIAKMEFKCNKYSNLIQKKQAKKHKLDPNGFVTFSSKFDAAVAAQGLMIRDPQSFITEPAVEPRDVFWFGMSLKTKERDVRQLIAYGLMFGLTFFWTIPITFISSLTTLSALSEELPWLDFINDLPESIVSFVQGFLPALILNIFLMIVPILIRIICVVSGVYAKSQISKMTLTRYFFFQVVNVFLVFTLSGAVLNQISDIINDPLSIATLLANSIPKQSLFFINFIMVDGIIGSYGDLFRLVPLVIWNIKMKLAKTPKEKEDASEPDGFEYDENYPKQLILLLVVLVFSTISPLIILFGVAAFGSSFLVNKYNLIYVCDKEFETGGSFWPVVFNRIATCVTISQITMAGYFSIMKAPGPAAAMVPLIIATFLYYSTATERYSFPAQNVPLRLAKKETLDTDPDRDTVLKTANATFDVMMKAGGSMVKAGGSVVKVGGDVVRAGGSVVALLTKGATFTKPMRKIALENQKSEFTMGDGENEDVESDVNNNNSNNNYNNNNNNDNDNKESNDNNDNSGPNESNNNNTQEESLPNKPKTLFSFGRHNKQTDVEEGANLRKTLLKSKLETNDKKEAVVEIPDEGSSSNNNNNDDGKVEETSESVAANNSGASSSRGTKVTSCHEHNVANCPHDMCRKLTAHDLKFAYLQSELRCDVSDPFKHVIDVKPAPAVRKGASIIGIAGLENEEEEEERKKNENENENENNNKGKENKGKNPTSSSTTENKESDSDNDKPTNTKLTNSVSKLSFQRQASRFSQLADEEDVEKGKEVKPVLRPMVVDDSSDSDSSDSDDDDDDDVDRDAKRMKHIDVDDRPESDEKEKQKRAARNNAADGGASSPSFLQKVAKFFGFDSASSSHQEPQQYQQQQLPQQQQQHYHEDQDQDHENVSLKSMSRK